jgi:hypothetical protein
MKFLSRKKRKSSRRFSLENKGYQARSGELKREKERLVPGYSGNQIVIDQLIEDFVFKKMNNEIETLETWRDELYQAGSGSL